MKFHLNPNRTPLLVVVAVVGLLLVLLRIDAGARTIPAEESMRALAPGGTLYVGTSPIESLWRSLAAHVDRAAGNADDKFAKPISDAADYFRDQCFPLAGVDGLRTLGIDIDRGMAAAMYGNPIEAYTFENTQWAVALPLSDATIFQRAVLALSGQPQKALLKSPGVGVDGRIIVTKIVSDGQYRACGYGGEIITPGRSLRVSDDEGAITLVSASDHDQVISIFCKGLDKSGHVHACSCDDRQSGTPVRKSKPCRIAVSAGGLKQEWITIEQKSYLSLSFSDPDQNDASKDTKSPVLIVIGDVALLASDTALGIRCIEGMDTNADRLQQDDDLSTISSLIDPGRGRGWIRGDVQVPEPFATGRVPFVLNLSPRALQFKARVELDTSDATLLNYLLEPSTGNAPPLVAGAVASLRSGTEIVRIWKYVQAWLPDIHHDLSTDLGYFAGVLDSVQPNSINSIRFTVLGFRDRVPDAVLGLKMSRASADAMTLTLQRSMRTNRDNRILLAALHLAGAGAASNLNSLANMLAREDGADWHAYRYVPWHCGREVSEPEHFAGALPASSFTGPAYLFKLPGATGRYVMPPITDNDFLFGAFARQVGTKAPASQACGKVPASSNVPSAPTVSDVPSDAPAEISAPIDRARLEGNAFRLGAVYFGDTLWFGTDDQTLKALIIGIQDGGVSDFCGTTAETAAAAVISTCLSPVLFTASSPDGTPYGLRFGRTPLMRLQNALSSSKWLARHYRLGTLQLIGDQARRTLTIEGRLE